MTQDDHVFATSRGTGILVVYKIDISGKLTRSMSLTTMMMTMMMTMAMMMTTTMMMTMMMVTMIMMIIYKGRGCAAQLVVK